MAWPGEKLTCMVRAFTYLRNLQGSGTFWRSSFVPQGKFGRLIEVDSSSYRDFPIPISELLPSHLHGRLNPDGRKVRGRASALSRLGRTSCFSSEKASVRSLRTTEK